MFNILIVYLEEELITCNCNQMLISKVSGAKQCFYAKLHLINTIVPDILMLSNLANQCNQMILQMMILDKKKADD